MLFNFHRYKFNFRMDFFVLCFLLFIVCCLLGVWQLHRYDYKKTLMMHYQSRMQSPPVSLATVLQSKEDQSFQPIKVTGHYVGPLTLLIQNRFYQGQLGHEVITPFEITGEKKLLLVDRGWSPLPGGPSLPAIKGTYDIIGRIKILNEYQFTLGKNILQPDERPLIIQKIDWIELARITHYNFFPFILRLDADQPAALVRDWTITTLSPERHLGYAIQWFVMALVLCIAYACFCMERVGNS